MRWSESLYGGHIWNRIYICWQYVEGKWPESLSGGHMWTENGLNLYLVVICGGKMACISACIYCRKTIKCLVMLEMTNLNIVADTRIDEYSNKSPILYVQ